MQPRERTWEKKFHDGRDELNLADFPISVLQRQQPLDADGEKADTAVYESSRYDPATRQRQRQRVVLESSSRHGLPTPADENVVLALLFVAKHTHDFADPVVPFSPRQLFAIMGWAPNSRSYDRLRAVLRRLQALVIRYENSWWDIAGRGYEAEVATGIISEYELGRQVSGRKRGASAPCCWVCWTPHFHQSLRSGNLKKLDLERLFSLRLPTSQRLYRFLDKRFYPAHQPPVVEMDLKDFACGHIGLSAVDNVAELKRRLAPAIAELEQIGFIARAEPAERYQKVRPGVWRVRFRAGPQFNRREPSLECAAPSAPAAESDGSARAEWEVVKEFYTRWKPGESHHVGDSDLAHARDLIAAHGAAAARGVVSELVGVLARRWPECKTFSGAVLKYRDEAVRAYQQRQRRDDDRSRDQAQRQLAQQEAERDAGRRRQLEAHWHGLPEAERRRIEEVVLQDYPEHRGRAALLKVLCLDRLAANFSSGG